MGWFQSRENLNKVISEMANKLTKKKKRIDYEAMYQDCVNDFTDKNTFILLQILAELRQKNGKVIPMCD
jgi:hypothetical protein